MSVPNNKNLGLTVDYIYKLRSLEYNNHNTKCIENF